MLTSSRRSSIIPALLVLALFSAGLAVRLIAFRNPPGDIEGWRQFASACIARGMYYDMQPGADPNRAQQAAYLAATFGVQEPRVFERVVALTNLVFHTELLWVARAWAITFWLAGCLFFFLLARRALGFPAAALALIYPLFLPYAVAFSRAFLPDVLMTALLMAGFWLAHRWLEQPTWRRALTAGAVLGLAILIKIFAVFFVAFGLAGMLLAQRGLRLSLTDRQVWAVAALTVFIPALYYLVPRADFTPGGYFETFVLPFTSRLLDWQFWLQWRNRLTLFNLGLVIASLVFAFLLPKALRGLTLGLWLGYLVYGMVLAGPIYHEYYSLTVVYIGALGLAGIAGRLVDLVWGQRLVWRLALIAVLLFIIADSSFQARKQLRFPDFSAEPAFWAELSADLPDGRYIGVAEDYNTRMQYYGWRFIAFYSYPGEADMAVPEANPERFNAQDLEYFLSRTEGSDYFIATTPIDRVTKNILYTYYPLVHSGARWWVFDLNHPLSAVQ